MKCARIQAYLICKSVNTKFFFNFLAGKIIYILILTTDAVLVQIIWNPKLSQ